MQWSRKFSIGAGSEAWEACGYVVMRRPEHASLYLPLTGAKPLIYPNVETAKKVANYLYQGWSE